MPTATTASLEKPMSPEEGWKTIEAPELYSFEKAGEQIAGILTEVSHVEVGEPRKKVVQYVLAADQKVIKILGTYDLVQKLTRAHIGCMVRIKLLGTDPSIARNGNAMKVFHIMIKGTPTHQASSPITDEDIPF